MLREDKNHKIREISNHTRPAFVTVSARLWYIEAMFDRMRRTPLECWYTFIKTDQLNANESHGRLLYAAQVHAR